MQQTQNDHDDTAQTWLETHQRSQTELDRLQQLLVETEQNHAHALAQLRHTNDEQHQDSETRLAQLNEDRDAQAQHMDALEAQIEDLQTRLEEATLRLETATLKPSLSPALSPSPSLTTATTTTTAVDHDLCQQKQKALEHEVTTLQQQLIHQKQQLIDEHQHQMATQKQQQNDDARTRQDSTNEKLIDVAKQHKKEVQLLHDQYQQLVDLKDQELEAYAYRVKSLNVARQKDLESCRADSTERINHMEHQIEGYEVSLSVPLFPIFLFFFLSSCPSSSFTLVDLMLFLFYISLQVSLTHDMILLLLPLYPFVSLPCLLFPFPSSSLPLGHHP
jgi:hypothetical protein